MQNHYNLIYREEEREMIPQCIDQGVGIIPWSPLARGVLAGNQTRQGEKRTTRSETDGFTDYLYGPATWPAIAECRQRRSHSHGCCRSPA
jgi:aryl-alcohol dehydrogenase-like predicted oxidoreductase